MAKHSTYPTCLDEVKTITLSCLRQMGYLRPHQRRRGILSWSIGGEPSGGLSVLTDTENRYIELRYLSNGKPISYQVNLESRPSNLGIGIVWYFICPATGKRCRTLYHCGDYFYSRHAFYQPMYSSQIESKPTREFLRSMRLLRLHDDFLSKRHSRTHYRGKITRRYQRVLNREDRFNPRGIISALEQCGLTDLAKRLVADESTV